MNLEKLLGDYNLRVLKGKKNVTYVVTLFALECATRLNRVSEQCKTDAWFVCEKKKKGEEEFNDFCFFLF